MPPAVGSGCWASDRGYGARREAIERRAMRPPPRDFTDDERAAQAVSHTAGAPGAPGVLALHGFTGNPTSMRAVADAFAAAGCTSSCPGCPATAPPSRSMLTTGWADWTAEAEDAYQRLAARASTVVVAGLSMGGSLALWTALRHPEIAGIVLHQPGDAAAARRDPRHGAARWSRRATR